MSKKTPEQDRKKDSSKSTSTSTPHRMDLISAPLFGVVEVVSDEEEEDLEVTFGKPIMAKTRSTQGGPK